ncbi:MAG: hypothetical protein Kow0027_31680 [Saprospiraceae bacterium]
MAAFTKNTSAMKYACLISASLFFVAMACNTAQKSTASGDDRQQDLNNPEATVSLVDHLRKFPGVFVDGSGENARVFIRGVNTISLDTEPLFVIDGQQIIGGLAAASRTVDVKDIKRIRVLKTAAETSRYGLRGANGVIEIVTKKE